MIDHDSLLKEASKYYKVRFNQLENGTYTVDGYVIPFPHCNVTDIAAYQWMLGYLSGWGNRKKKCSGFDTPSQTDAVYSRDRFSLLNSLLDQGMGFDVEEVPTAMDSKEYARTLEKLIEDWCLPQGFVRDADDELHYTFDDEKNASAYDARFIPEGDGFGHWHVVAKIASTKGTVVNVEATDYGFEDAYEAVRQAVMAVS